MQSYDVIVVGLGGAGSSSVFHLARSGASVLGLEQFGPVHPHGSSHGRSRIYRTAYFEGSAYVPMVQRAQQLWRDLERASGERIIRQTGGLVIGRPDSPTVSGAQRTATGCRLSHSVLSPDETRARFPQFTLRDEEVALWDPDAGVLFPETCIRAHAALAVDAGAELHYGEGVAGWTSESGSVVVRSRRAEYRARHLVLASGAWTVQVAQDLELPLEIERQFMLWFPPADPEAVQPDRMPVFVWDRGPEAETYGIPDFGDGVKIGSWHGRVAATPESADRVLRDSEADPVRQFVATSLKPLLPRERETASCLYTNAPDHNFLIGVHPQYPNVTVVSACSGHGFKFTSVVGEIVNHLVHGVSTGFDLRLFDPGRFRR